LVGPQRRRIGVAGAELVGGEAVLVRSEQLELERLVPVLVRVLRRERRSGRSARDRDGRGAGRSGAEREGGGGEEGARDGPVHRATLPEPVRRDNQGRTLIFASAGMTGCARSTSSTPRLSTTRPTRIPTARG